MLPRQDSGARFTRDDRDRVLGHLADVSLRSELDDERLTAAARSGPTG